MKKIASKISFPIILLILIMNNYVLAIEQPENYSCSPTTITDTQVMFISEEVEYVVDDWWYAWITVTAHYVFKNPTNKTINQTIFLPFLEYVPDETLEIRANGNPILYIEDHSAYIEEFLSELVSKYHDSTSLASFNLSFKANETIIVVATYQGDSEREWGSDNPLAFLTDIHRCKYISKTGGTWNTSLQNASFTFKIKKNLYNSGLEGYNISYEGDSK